MMSGATPWTGITDMFAAPQIGMLPDGRRLHLNQGPIDLIIEAFGAPGEVENAYRQTAERFPDILPTLVRELAQLRTAVGTSPWEPVGPVATRMRDFSQVHGECFVTPMAAVAGSVADEMLEVLVTGRSLDRAYVNNGGDIAFHLTPGTGLTTGLVGDYHLPSINGTCALTHDIPVRGIATSGWKGRSYSLGIADSVTVLAECAAAADVAATLIANAVNTEHPAIQRTPAVELDPDSDLGERLVTTGVGDLGPVTVSSALDAGAVRADAMVRGGHIVAAVLVLQKEIRVVGSVPTGLLKDDAA
jgi:ApbE superfamily uncharacterized protein (UPF0280 family)